MFMNAMAKAAAWLDEPVLPSWLHANHRVAGHASQQGAGLDPTHEGTGLSRGRMPFLPLSVLKVAMALRRTVVRCNRSIRVYRLAEEAAAPMLVT